MVDEEIDFTYPQTLRKIAEDKVKESLPNLLFYGKCLIKILVQQVFFPNDLKLIQSRLPALSDIFLTHSFDDL